MKFLTGLAVAASLVSSAVAAASQDAAPVYVLRKNEAADATTASPDIPRQIVRQILLQRLHVDEMSSLIDNLPKDYDAEIALDFINRYGVAPAPLFAADVDAVSPPAQLVVMLEGVSSQQAKKLADALPEAYRQPSFTVADPPSKAANERFLVSELAQADVTVQRKDLQAAFDESPRRWDGGLFVGLYDVSQSSTVLDVLEANMDRIASLIDTHEIEATFVLLPESSRSSKLNYWTTAAPSAKLSPSELRKLRARAAQESVMLEASDDSNIDSLSDDDSVFEESDESSSSSSSSFTPTTFDWASSARSAASIPACFQSFNSCVAQTGNCSNHGVCLDKYAYNSGSNTNNEVRQSQRDNAASCFVCHCYSTLDRPEEADRGPSTTKWAGNMCHKKDVSTPFWLLTGFTVILVGLISFSIGMLFDVGEEKLPGVIGAGVSRSK